MWVIYCVINSLFYRSLDIFYATTYTILSILGILGNSFAFFYFRTHRRDISNILYKIISLNDALICLTALPVSISLFNHRSPYPIFSNTTIAPALLLAS